MVVRFGRRKDTQQASQSWKSRLKVEFRVVMVSRDGRWYPPGCRSNTTTDLFEATNDTLESDVQGQNQG